MLKSGVILVVMFLFVSFSSVAVGQEYTFDASVAVGPALSRSTSGNQTSQTATETGVGLGTFRVNFSRHSSAEFTYSRLRNTQIYNSPPYLYRIQDHVSEYTGSYIYRPFRWNRIRPFGLAGGGVLRFYPEYTGTTVNGVVVALPTVNQTRATFLFGVGMDYRITKHWGARLQYRGFLYEAPDFKVNNLFTGATGLLSEPTLGVTFRF
jgi:opacity protein-like surface antigen